MPLASTGCSVDEARLRLLSARRSPVQHLRDASRAVRGAGGLDDDRLASVLEVQVYPALVRIVVLVVIPVVDLVLEVQADAPNQRVSRRRRDPLGEEQEGPLHQARTGRALRALGS